MQLMQHLIEQMLKIRCKSYFRNSLFVVVETKNWIITIKYELSYHSPIAISQLKPQFGFIKDFLYISLNS